MFIEWMVWAGWLGNSYLPDQYMTIIPLSEGSRLYRWSLARLGQGREVAWKRDCLFRPALLSHFYLPGYLHHSLSPY